VAIFANQYFPDIKLSPYDQALSVAKMPMEPNLPWLEKHCRLFVDKINKKKLQDS